MFLDASAMVCLLTQEPEELFTRIEANARRLTSRIAVYEATLAVRRKQQCGVEAAAELVEEFIATFGAEIVSIGHAEAIAAFAPTTASARAAIGAAEHGRLLRLRPRERCAAAVQG